MRNYIDATEMAKILTYLFEHGFVGIDSMVLTANHLENLSFLQIDGF